MKRLIISVIVALCLAILGMICMSAQSTYKSELRKECKIDK